MAGEEAVSIVSNSIIEEVSDSTNSTSSSLTPKHESRICSSKYRGVVPLPNGHWGCQIYANHQRIWLGTFKSEKEAGMAYDSVALKLRRGDCRRNFPLTDLTIKEPNFQSYYTTEALLNMIKDGSYQLKLADFARTHMQNSMETDILHGPGRVTCTQLFQKELTPSDVGKLNRLVIPKKFAVKFFANLSLSAEENDRVDMANDGLLTFVDNSMKFWKFRYCYWKSSHSYVFTRGWNRFVKEKQLNPSDTIVFSLCECWEDAKVTQTYYMIDVISSGNSSHTWSEPSSQSILRGMERNFQLGQNTSIRYNIENVREEEEVKVTNDADRKSFRLFGTEIV